MRPKRRLRTDLTHGGFVGTPSFASPGTIRRRAADARSDIYSLGVTLWYALTGQLPYPGKTIEEIRDRQRRPPSDRTIGCEKTLAPLVDLLQRTLAVDPAQRPASSRELLKALESCRATSLGLTGRVCAAGAAAILVAARRRGRTLRPSHAAPDNARRPQFREKSIAVLPFENLSDDKAKRLLRRRYPGRCPDESGADSRVESNQPHERDGLSNIGRAQYA